jgi:heme/copper-type cytochrome/quinol oxidase subunit 3
LRGEFLYADTTMSTAHAATLDDATSTGIPSAKLGMWIFLASEVMFFTGLIGAYIVLRLSSPSWPGPEGHLSVPLGTTNTFVLICSSMTIVMALAASERSAMPALRGWLTLTLALGGVFLGIKGFEYSTKFAHHILPSTNVFWSCYYALTGLHALHVIIGMGLNAWVLSMTRAASLLARRGHLLELAGLYWHFVDIVWIFLFPMLYLMH